MCVFLTHQNLCIPFQTATTKKAHTQHTYIKLNSGKKKTNSSFALTPYVQSE